MISSRQMTQLSIDCGIWIIQFGMSYVALMEASVVGVGETESKSSFNTAGAGTASDSSTTTSCDEEELS